MILLKLHIDTVSYNTKPKEHISIIKPRLQSEKNIKEVTVRELDEAIEQGKSISPAVMRGGIRMDNWSEQQVFMVDIDNDKEDTDILIEAEALYICQQYNLLPAFYYHSFSHTKEKPKYRLVFVMDKVVTDTYKRKIICESLIGLFSQSDTSCKNADRVFFGTDSECIFCDGNARISYEDVIKAYKPEAVKQVVTNDSDLERLKRDFDFLSYLKERNGQIYKEDSKIVMFENCELCGHKKDLVYYKDTNSFMCFGAGCHKGGSVIDYIMLSQKMDLKQAIDHFKYDLCKLQRPIIKVSTKKIINTGLSERLLELQPHIKYSLNDKGFGELFADVYKDEARYNVTAKEWYVYNGRVWEADIGAMKVSQKAKELTDALLVYATTIENETSKNEYVKHLCKLGQLKYRNTMISDARDKYYISAKKLDSNLDLFNCQNGTLNLKTFEFTEHKASDMLTKISNVHYDPTKESKEFEKFIFNVMEEDIEKIKYLQKVIGYSITADTSLETCFILYGATTRNGKSTLVETLSYMLGNGSGYALNMQPQTLAQKQNKDTRQASGDIARLDGCRFLNASEPPKRMIFDVALLKTLLGRDSITARHLNEREFEFIPHFKLFINTNFLPLITDDTLFTSGRINVITFDRHFEPHEQDRGLKDRLIGQDNLSGIFNWCIEGLKLFREKGARPPKTVTDSTAEYRSSSDKVGNFVDECMMKANENTKAGDVYSCYKGWCIENGFGVENKGNFFDELRVKNMFATSGRISGKPVRNVVKGYCLIA